MYVQEQERQGSKMRALLSKRPWRAFTEQPLCPSHMPHGSLLKTTLPYRPAHHLARVENEIQKGAQS